MSELLLTEAHKFLDWARAQGAGLDGTDDSIAFVYGILYSMASDADEDPAERGVKILAYSVYLAELLASTCRGVRCVVDGDGMTLRDVVAVHDESGTMQFTLQWVLGCLEDPVADSIAFKYIGALHDFGESERARYLTALFGYE